MIVETIVGVGSILTAKVVHFVLEIPFPILFGRSDLKSFFMDRYPKDEAIAKNFVWNKSSSYSQ